MRQAPEHFPTSGVTYLMLAPTADRTATAALWRFPSLTWVGYKTPLSPCWAASNVRPDVVATSPPVCNACQMFAGAG